MHQSYLKGKYGFTVDYARSDVVCLCAIGRVFGNKTARAVKKLYRRLKKR